MATKRLLVALPLVLMILLLVGFAPQWVPSAPALPSPRRAALSGDPVDCRHCACVAHGD